MRFLGSRLNTFKGLARCPVKCPSPPLRDDYGLTRRDGEDSTDPAASGSADDAAGMLVASSLWPGLCVRVPWLPSPEGFVYRTRHANQTESIGGSGSGDRSMTVDRPLCG